MSRYDDGHYHKLFEKTYREAVSLIEASAKIHHLVLQLIEHNPKKIKQINDAKFQCLTHAYFNFFNEQIHLDEHLLRHITNAIPNDTLFIRYAYHSVIYGKTHKQI